MSFVLDVIAKPTVILMSAAGLSIVLRRSSAAVRHAVWILAIAGAMLVPLAGLLVPRFDWPLLLDAGTSVTFLRAEDTQAMPLHAPLANHLPMPIQPATMWVLGMTFVLLRLAMATRAVQRMKEAASTTADDNWRQLVTELCSAFDIRRPVRLLFGEKHLSPMTWSVWRHTILLPSTAEEWSTERRRLVLAHVKRNDGLLQILVQLACGFYWFNPMVWYAAHRVRIEREHACDDRVLSLGAEAVDYADHLVQVVRGLAARRSLMLASVLMAQPSQLEGRLVSILDFGARRRTMSRREMILLCTLAGLITSSIAAIGIAAAVPLPPVLVPPMTVALPSFAPLLPAKPAAIPKSASTAPSPPGYTKETVEAVEATPQETETPIRVGAGVTPPTVIFRVEPTYTDEAREAKYEGTVVAKVTIHKDGTLTLDNVIRALDYGLTERAIEALEQWKFKPAMKDDEPVAVSLTVEVNFNLK